MTRSKKTGKSSQPAERSLHNRVTRRKNGTCQSWIEDACISTRDADQEFTFKSPNYFEGLQNEDPDFYRAVMESLKTTTYNQSERREEDPDLHKAILESLKPQWAGAELQEGAVGEVSMKDSLHGSVAGDGTLSRSVQFASDDTFEVWEDDVYERAMSEDGWETIELEGQSNARPLYSVVLRGYNANGAG